MSDDPRWPDPIDTPVEIRERHVTSEVTPGVKCDACGKHVARIKIRPIDGRGRCDECIARDIPHGAYLRSAEDRPSDATPVCGWLPTGPARDLLKPCGLPYGHRQNHNHEVIGKEETHGSVEHLDSRHGSASQQQEPDGRQPHGGEVRSRVEGGGPLGDGRDDHVRRGGERREHLGGGGVGALGQVADEGNAPGAVGPERVSAEAKGEPDWQKLVSPLSWDGGHDQRIEGEEPCNEGVPGCTVDHRWHAGFREGFKRAYMAPNMRAVLEAARTLRECIRDASIIGASGDPYDAIARLDVALASLSVADSKMTIDEDFMEWLGREYGACEVADLPSLTTLLAEYRASSSA